MANASAPATRTRNLDSSPAALNGHRVKIRASNLSFTAFMLIEPFKRSGELIEFAPTPEIFEDAKDSRTRDYVSGRLG